MGDDVVADGEFAAFVGIDWAEQKHVLALQDRQAGRIEIGEIKHTPEAVDAWAMELAQRYEERPIAVALEQVRGSFGVHAYEIQTPGHLPDPPSNSSQLS